MFSSVLKRFGSLTLKVAQQVRPFQCSIAQAQTRGVPTCHALHSRINFPPMNILDLNLMLRPNLMITRGMNRNARRPKRANHGKRPVSHARKRAKAKLIKSRLYREKVFGFW
jgi:hypothetical protein